MRQRATRIHYSGEMSDSLFGPPSSRPRSERWRRLAESGIVRKPESVSARVVVIMRVADQLAEQGEHEEAARELVRALDLLDGRQESLAVDVYLRLGRANHALARTTACLQSYKKGLEIDPDHAPTLQALVDLHFAWNELAEATVAEERLFHCATSDEEHIVALVRSGDRWWKGVGNPGRARQRYRRALAVAVAEEARSPLSERIRARLRALRASSDDAEPRSRTLSRRRKNRTLKTRSG